VSLQFAAVQDTHLSSNSDCSKKSSAIFAGKRGVRLLGLRFTIDNIVKGFFGGNAYLAIICLLFICLFLLRAAMGFFPGYRTELSEARKSGIEFVNVLKEEVAGFTALRRKMELAYISEKRVRFGDDVSVILLYNRFEGTVDDTLDEAVEAYTEKVNDGTVTEADTIALTNQVKQNCLALSPEEITLALSPLGITKTSDKIKQRAIDLAVKYALNDAETPENIETLSQKIRTEMGDFTNAFETISAAGGHLKKLESSLASHAQETVHLLQRKREIPERIKALREGSKKISDPEERAKKLAMAKKLEESLNTDFSIDDRAQVFYQSIEKHHKIVEDISQQLKHSLTLLPAHLESPKAAQTIEELRSLMPAYIEILHKKEQALKAWKHDTPVGIGTAVKAFFFGTQWQTNSDWQDVYGILPLLTGSLLIAGVSLLIAVPIAIGAALYVNQFSHRREAAMLKPAIEFVQAIPSVVLGLFGVLVLAGLLKDASAHPLLSWIPGFPIQERLNVLLASLLLAFMAAPTIFTLAEDALNNVPKAYTEASLAMGATRLQTTLKIVLPAAISGIIAAVLLGFGRIIGETMVVLLVAGNKATIPDFSHGLAAVTQPVHTMTSIIAQECGEVETGSLHYMALFMVGLILFTISLSVNSLCQKVLKNK